MKKIKLWMVAVATMIGGALYAQEKGTLPDYVTGVNWIMPDGYLGISEHQPGKLDEISGHGSVCRVKFDPEGKSQVYYVEVVGIPGMQRSYFLCYQQPDGTHPRVEGKEYENFVLWLCPDCLSQQGSSHLGDQDLGSIP